MKPGIDFPVLKLSIVEKSKPGFPGKSRTFNSICRNRWLFFLQISLTELILITE